MLPNLRAQSSEALMDALVRKGILTEQEAEDIKADVSKENKQYNKWTFNKDGLEYKLYGDVRGRYEFFRTENDAIGAGEPNKNRDRLRYRLRAGLTATLNDRFEVGMRLTSSDPDGSFGGDPISGNTTFQNNASKKFVFIDLAYGKWTPLMKDNYFLSGTIGKMENPFVVSDMVFDGDYTPEGIALQGGYTFNEIHSMKWNSGLFILDETGQGALASNDPMMWGLQARWDASWTTDPAKYPKIQTSFGAALLGITETDSLGNAAVPNIQGGNTRFPATVAGSPHAITGNLVNDYQAVVLDGSATFTLEKFPMYPGAFPIRVGGEYMQNLGADDMNDGWWGGVSLGKAGKKRSWELSYRYKHLEADAWYEEFVDSDFGAHRQVAWPGSGLGAGYRSGTGVAGHITKFVYSLSDSMTVGATWFYTHMIDEPVVAGSKAESGQHRVQLDAIWKF
jgi:hypothetical protein